MNIITKLKLYLADLLSRFADSLKDSNKVKAIEDNPDKNNIVTNDIKVISCTVKVIKVNKKKEN